MEPTLEPTIPTPAPTNVLLDSILTPDNDVEGSFDLAEDDVLDFGVEADDDALCTIAVTGGNLTITQDDGTVIMVITADGSGSAMFSPGLFH